MSVRRMIERWILTSLSTHLYIKRCERLQVRLESRYDEWHIWR
jgi:hypothetical protein